MMTHTIERIQATTLTGHDMDKHPRTTIILCMALTFFEILTYVPTWEGVVLVASSDNSLAIGQLH